MGADLSNVQYFEASAKTGAGVDAVFQEGMHAMAADFSCCC